MKNLVIHTLYAAGGTSVLRTRKKNQLTVLSLHRVSDERNSFWNPIKPKTFDQLLDYVKKNYRVIDFNDPDTIDSSSSGKPFLILSFDDGYYDFLEFALPLLVKHKLPSNHNIVNECAHRNMSIWTERLNHLFEYAMHLSVDIEVEILGKKQRLTDHGNSWMAFYLNTFKSLLNTEVEVREIVIQDLENKLQVSSSQRMMNWDEIRECNANRVQIGSHTYSHDSIGTIASIDTLRKEILGSKSDIEKELGGKSVTVLALPNGQTGTAADKVIHESDFKFVLYVNDELNQLPINRNGQTNISRINLVDEPFPQMALRIEQFHKLLRKYV